MAATTLFLVNDSSTYANFFAWASPISAWLATSGWIQTVDTGQVMWSGLSISAVSVAGSNMTCTYSGLTGLALAVGRALTITGWTGGNTGNNGTFIITAVAPLSPPVAGSGTFTAVNASAVTVGSGGTGVVTAQSTVPGSGAYVYELWTPNDGLTAFYVKMEYGNQGAANSTAVACTLGTSTTGTGFVSGYTTSRFVSQNTAPGAVSATIPYECRFAGGTSYFCCMMWRTASNNNPICFSIERSVNSSGVYVANHVTLVVVGSSQATSGSNNPASQQTLGLTGAGVAPIVCQNSNASTQNFAGLSMRVPNPRISVAYNGAVPFDTLAPVIGYYDYPLYNLGVASYLSVSEGQLITVSLYGNSHTYICTQVYPLLQSFQGSASNYGNSLCMRYE